MLKEILFAIFQCFLLVCGQVCLKLGVVKVPKFQWTWAFFADLLTNWWLLAGGVCLGAAAIVWLYILKYFEFSIAHPLTAISFIFGMLVAIFIFHESVPLTRWIGVALIIAGAFFIIMKK